MAYRSNNDVATTKPEMFGYDIIVVTYLLFDFVWNQCVTPIINGTKVQFGGTLYINPKHVLLIFKFQKSL
jgi:hypothetical protein